MTLDYLEAPTIDDEDQEKALEAKTDHYEQGKAEYMMRKNRYDEEFAQAQAKRLKRDQAKDELQARKTDLT
jgi:hypothetical protein